MLLEVLEWVFLVAAIVILFVQFNSSSPSQYRALNAAFWVLMAGAFAVNGIESDTGWMWFWFIAAAASLVAAFVPPRGLRSKGGLGE